MNHGRSLRWQLLIGNTLIFSLLLAVLGGIIYWFDYQAVKENINSQNKHLTESIEESVDYYIETPIEMIDKMRNFIRNEAGELNRDVLATYLGTLTKVYPYIEEIKVIDAAGNITMVAPENPKKLGTSVLYEDYYLDKPLNSEIEWSNVYISAETGKPTVTITASAGELLLVGDLNLTLLEEMVSDKNYESLLYISLLDNHGIYLVDRDNKNVEQRNRHPDFELIKESALTGRTQMNSLLYRDILITGMKIGEGDKWYLAIGEDRKMIYAPLAQLTSILVISIVIIGASTFLFLFLNLKKAMEELKNLGHSTLLISEGQYDYKPEIGEFNELNELAEHFQVMVENISAREREINNLNENLENLVEDRTFQLKNTNHNLEEVNAQLEEEIMERQRVEEELFKVNASLEERVRERTLQLESMNRDLEESNANLEEEIEEHRQTVNLLEEKEAELEEALTIAEDSNLSKSQFLANMSHEIRTPMNGILGMIEVLSMTGLEREQQDYLRTVRSSADSLLTILNDILDYSKIEAGKVQIKNETFSISGIMNDIYNLFLATARHKGLEFTIGMEKNMPEFMVGDENRIRQVLSNLVGNALKFTTKGSVSLDVSGHWVTPNQYRIKFDVKDTGIGIAMEDQAQLFNRFIQLNRGSGKKSSGTGLGLAISKMLVQLMQGEIYVTSLPGEGSHFTVELEFLACEEAEAAIALAEHVKIPKKEKDFTGLRVLVVEDDPTSLYMMSVILTKLNAQVMTADDGIKALRMLEGELQDIVLMDVNMPEMDGLATTMEIRRRGVLNRKNQPIPVIATTAYAMSGDREKCIEAGMTDYLSKPVELEIMKEKIFLNWNTEGDPFNEIDELGEEVQVSERVVSLEEHEVIGMDAYFEVLEALEQASGLDRENCDYILRTYLDQAKKLVKDIRDLLDHARTENENAELGILIHKLKGSSGNTRVLKVMDSAMAAEQAFKMGDFSGVKDTLPEIEQVLLILEGNIKK